MSTMHTTNPNIKDQIKCTSVEIPVIQRPWLEKAAKHNGFFASVLRYAQRHDWMVSPKQAHYVQAGYQATGSTTAVRKDDSKHKKLFTFTNWLNVVELLENLHNRGIINPYITLLVECSYTTANVIIKRNSSRLTNEAKYLISVDSKYYGAVDVNGHSTIAMYKSNTPLLVALNTQLANLKDAIKQHGKLTGKCSCCGRPLTNPHSLELGVGPVCATNLGIV